MKKIIMFLALCAFPMATSTAFAGCAKAQIKCTDGKSFTIPQDKGDLGVLPCGVNSDAGKAQLKAAKDYCAKIYFANPGKSPSTGQGFGIASKTIGDPAEDARAAANDQAASDKRAQSEKLTSSSVVKGIKGIFGK